MPACAFSPCAEAQPVPRGEDPVHCTPPAQREVSSLAEGEGSDAFPLRISNPAQHLLLT